MTFYLPEHASPSTPKIFQDVGYPFSSPSHLNLGTILERRIIARIYLAYILESAPQDVRKINHHAMASRSSCESDLSASTMVD